MLNKTFLWYLIGLGLGAINGSIWTRIYYKNKIDVEHAELNGFLNGAKTFLKDTETEKES